MVVPWKVAYPFFMQNVFLPLSSKQRTMSTSIEVNKEAVEFMLKFVAAMLSDRDGNRFRSEYTCRPCFAKFEKGCSHYKHTILLINELSTAARATGIIKVAVNEPFPLLADLPESPGCNQVFRKGCVCIESWQKHHHHL